MVDELIKVVNINQYLLIFNNYDTINMILLLLLILPAISFCTHLYWFEKDRPNLNSNSDKSWSYCDQKCLYL